MASQGSHAAAAANARNYLPPALLEDERHQNESDQNPGPAQLPEVAELQIKYPMGGTNAKGQGGPAYA